MQKSAGSRPVFRRWRRRVRAPNGPALRCSAEVRSGYVSVLISLFAVSGYYCDGFCKNSTRKWHFPHSKKNTPISASAAQERRVGPQRGPSRSILRMSAHSPLWMAPRGSSGECPGQALGPVIGIPCPVPISEMFHNVKEGC